MEEELAEATPIEPYEVQELRQSNRLSLKTFELVCERSLLRFPNGVLTYPQFIDFVRGETGIDLRSGHLLDRLFDDPRHSPIPLPLALTALQLAVRDSPEERARALFRIRINQDPSREPSMRGQLSSDGVQALVADLQRSCQLPVEKQVTETGVRYPYRTHRRKTPADMVAKARTRLSPPNQGDSFTEEEVLEMLLGPEICVWGECYRGGSD